MQTDAPPRKVGGRLSREDQRRLGDILQRVYDEVVKQGVPDRFRDLLQELNEGRDRPQATAAPSRSSGSPEQAKDGDAADDPDERPDRSVGAKSVADPGNNGSHR